MDDDQPEEAETEAAEIDASEAESAWIARIRKLATDPKAQRDAGMIAAAMTASAIVGAKTLIFVVDKKPELLTKLVTPSTLSNAFRAIRK